MSVINIGRKSWMNLQEHYLTALDDPWYKTLVEIQDAISTSTLKFFSKRGLKMIHLPITTHSISSPMGLGSDSQPVKIQLFGIDTYLADSMQFMLEYGCRLHSPGCYYLMPSFRGEHADETHLCQFYHSEAEIIGSIDDVMTLVEEYLRFMCAELLWACSTSIRSITQDVSHIQALVQSQGALPRITLDHARRLLNDDPAFVRSEAAGYSVLTRAGERALIKHFGGFVWLTEQDHLAVPFYQAFADPEGKKAKAADLLFGLGEVVGSGERHATTQEVHRALTMHHVDPEPYEWYCGMREKLPLQTAGFGLGTERFICWLLNHDDVRDCQILPRFNGIVTIP
jgi:asparaginyl-tRNA synthetase